MMNWDIEELNYPVSKCFVDDNQLRFKSVTSDGLWLLDEEDKEFFINFHDMEALGNIYRTYFSGIPFPNFFSDITAKKLLSDNNKNDHIIIVEFPLEDISFNIGMGLPYNDRPSNWKLSIDFINGTFDYGNETVKWEGSFHLLKCGVHMFEGFNDLVAFSGPSGSSRFSNHWNQLCGDRDFFINMKSPSVVILKDNPNGGSNTLVGQVSLLLQKEEKKKEYQILKEQLFESLLGINVNVLEDYTGPEVNISSGLITYRVGQIPEFLVSVQTKALVCLVNNEQKWNYFNLTFDFNTCILSCYPERVEHHKVKFDFFWFTRFKIVTERIDSLSYFPPPKPIESKKEVEEKKKPEPVPVVDSSDTESDEEVKEKEKKKKKKKSIDNGKEKEKKEEKKVIVNGHEKKKKEEKKVIVNGKEKKKNKKPDPPSDSKEEKKESKEEKKKRKPSKDKSNPKNPKKQNGNSTYRESLQAQKKRFQEKAIKLAKNISSGTGLARELVLLQYVGDGGNFECEDKRCKSKVACVEGGLCHTCGEIIGPLHHHMLRFCNEYFISPNLDDKLEKELLDELPLMKEALIEYLKDLGIPEGHEILSLRGISNILNYYSFVDCGENDHLAVIPIQPEMNICRTAGPSRILKSDEYLSVSKYEQTEKVFCARGVCELCIQSHWIFHRKTKPEKEDLAKLKVKEEGKGTLRPHIIYFNNTDKPSGKILPYSKERRALCRKACEDAALLQARKFPSPQTIREIRDEYDERIKEAKAKKNRDPPKRKKAKTKTQREKKLGI